MLYETPAFVTPALWIDRGAVMAEAHIYARCMVQCDRRATYRREFAEGLSRAWARAKFQLTRAIVHGFREPTAEARAVHAEIVSIQMKDRMNSADFDRLATLQAEEKRLAAA